MIYNTYQRHNKGIVIMEHINKLKHQWFSLRMQYWYTNVSNTQCHFDTMEHVHCIENTKHQLLTTCLNYLHLNNVQVHRMYKLFTSSCQLQLHLIKVVVRISMHAYVSLAQTRSCIIPQCQVIATQIASCTRTVDST